MVRFFTILLIPLLCIVMGGCGGEVNITTPPPISEAKSIAITPFFAESEEINKLGSRISVNLATRLELIFKEAEWVYDISKKIKPVDDKLSELGLTLNQIYMDPALAAKLGQALGTDMIIIGMVEEPKLTRQDYDRHLMKQGRQGGISGTSTYIRTRLTAIGRIRVKVVDSSSGSLFLATAFVPISSIGMPIRRSRANNKSLRPTRIGSPIWDNTFRSELPIFCIQPG